MKQACLRLISCVLGSCFLITTSAPSYAQTLPLTGTGVWRQLPVAGEVSAPTLNTNLKLKGVKIDPADPLQLDFIVSHESSNSQKKVSDTIFKGESRKLIKYFLAALTIPEKDLWVNLSPDEPDRIIPHALGKTDLGRDMLIQDYYLKQITSSLLNPDTELGRQFWDNIYAKAFEKYGTTNIPIDTFSRVWIVPEKADIYEFEGGAYILDKKLKVMLEEDYLKKGARHLSEKVSDTNIDAISTSVMREIIVPALEQEVNEGKTFLMLRQIYEAQILAVWYKHKIKESLIKESYIDRNKISGVNHQQKNSTQTVYQQYLESVKKGVFNFIRDEFDVHEQEEVPHHYFSGGLEPVDFAQLNFRQPKREELFASATQVSIHLDPAMKSFDDDSDNIIDFDILREEIADAEIRQGKYNPADQEVSEQTLQALRYLMGEEFIVQVGWANDWYMNLDGIFVGGEYDPKDESFELFIYSQDDAPVPLNGLRFQLESALNEEIFLGDRIVDELADAVDDITRFVFQPLVPGEYYLNVKPVSENIEKDLRIVSPSEDSAMQANLPYHTLDENRLKQMEQVKRILIPAVLEYRPKSSSEFIIPAEYTTAGRSLNFVETLQEFTNFLLNEFTQLDLNGQIIIIHPEDVIIKVSGSLTYLRNPDDNSIYFSGVEDFDADFFLPEEILFKEIQRADHITTVRNVLEDLVKNNISRLPFTKPVHIRFNRDREIFFGSRHWTNFYHYDEYFFSNARSRYRLEQIRRSLFTTHRENVLYNYLNGYREIKNLWDSDNPEDKWKAAKRLMQLAYWQREFEAIGYPLYRLITQKAQDPDYILTSYGHNVMMKALEWANPLFVYSHEEVPELVEIFNFDYDRYKFLKYLDTEKQMDGYSREYSDRFFIDSLKDERIVAGGSLKLFAELGLNSSKGPLTSKARESFQVLKKLSEEGVINPDFQWVGYDRSKMIIDQVRKEEFTNSLQVKTVWWRLFDLLDPKSELFDSDIIKEVHEFDIKDLKIPYDVIRMRNTAVNYQTPEKHMELRRRVVQGLRENGWLFEQNASHELLMQKNTNGLMEIKKIRLFFGEGSGDGNVFDANALIMRINQTLFSFAFSPYFKTAAESLLRFQYLLQDSLDNWSDQESGNKEAAQIFQKYFQDREGISVEMSEDNNIVIHINDSALAADNQKDVKPDQEDYMNNLDSAMRTALRSYYLEYVVKPGEFLESIGAKFYADSEDIRQYSGNSQIDFDHLKGGEYIVVPIHNQYDYRYYVSFIRTLKEQEKKVHSEFERTYLVEELMEFVHKVYRLDKWREGFDEDILDFRQKIKETYLNPGVVMIAFNRLIRELREFHGAVFKEKSEQDSAMGALNNAIESYGEDDSRETGGVDLSGIEQKISIINNDEQEVAGLKWDYSLQSDGFLGFNPIVLNVSPILDLGKFLGVYP